MAPERLADARGEHAAAAERDRAAVRLLQQLANDLGLATAERLLPVLFEGAADRLAEPLFHQVVDLGRLQPGLAGRGESGRLAGPHQAGDDQRRLHRTRPPLTTPEGVTRGFIRE